MLLTVHYHLYTIYNSGNICNISPYLGSKLQINYMLLCESSRVWLRFGLWFMVFNATFNNISVISWWSVLLVEETGENQRPVASH